ncbi:hypothetical protein [Rickettsiella endosymbiont of Dermanyssus gallinae]|uniref:hypothetical protein n=1 Tax=Rickettsiella endosymbiont of Dermanyssus gallinae TaxID=2856608 RepID=UPI001C5296D8|nr:hypothetical protein [Rickettsiella endosymbiont of Dermanyssus gallinae]
MTNIRVHLLNFHSVFNSHIEIVLEDLSSKAPAFYSINRWETPLNKWSRDPNNCIQRASSVYSFDIVADPAAITENWNQYWDDTSQNASILSENCAVAAQWFLSEFANIPKPDSSNVSLNYLSCGIVWPSFIPCFVTLPGRVFANAKFHAEAENNPEMAAQYKRLLEYTYKALAVLAFGITSTLAVTVVLPLAIAVLTIGVTAVIAVGCVVVGSSNAYHFFKTKDSPKHGLPKELVSEKYIEAMDNFLSNENASTPALAA